MLEDHSINQTTVILRVSLGLAQHQIKQCQKYVLEMHSQYKYDRRILLELIMKAHNSAAKEEGRKVDAK